MERIIGAQKFIEQITMYKNEGTKKSFLKDKACRRFKKLKRKFKFLKRDA